MRDAVRQKVRSTTAPLRLAVCDLSTSPYVDMAGARMLATLHDDLAPAGTRLRLAEAHGAVRDILRAGGLEERVGRVSRRISVDDVVETVRSQTESQHTRRTR